MTHDTVCTFSFPVPNGAQPIDIARLLESLATGYRNISGHVPQVPTPVAGGLSAHPTENPIEAAPAPVEPPVKRGPGRPRKVEAQVGAPSAEATSPVPAVEDVAIDAVRALALDLSRRISMAEIQKLLDAQKVANISALTTPEARVATYKGLQALQARISAVSA
jgi:hypothetical protein